MNTKLKTIILCLGTLLYCSSAAFSQYKNELLDREFWKTQPGTDQIKEKIDQGHSPTAMTSANFDATVYAILENNPLETIKFLLIQGNDVNKLTHDARTYIFWAAYKSNLELMKYLTSQGAKADLIDQHGYTVLMFAASTGQENTAIYDYCIALGMDIRQEKDRSGRNALLAYAGSMKNFEVVRYFVDKGLDVHSKDADGNGIFHHAAKTGSEGFMKRLVSEYKVDYKKNEATNENAILFASKRFSRSGEENPFSFYQYLEEIGLDPAITSTSGNTALINLAYNTKTKEVFNYFIEKGVNASSINKEGNNALIRSAIRNNLEVVKLFSRAYKRHKPQKCRGPNSLNQSD